MNMYKIKDYPKLDFRLVNRLAGWVVFLIASLTYILTAEPTASLWDCGEFITTSVGLQVGHPPGAPLFMIISRLFAIFAPSKETQALMINCMSALCSGFTVLFLFWSITHLARKLVVKEGEEMTMGADAGDSGRVVGGGADVHVHGYVLVLGGGGRGVCDVVAVHGGGFLGDTEVGECGVRAVCQPGGWY